MNKKSYDLIVIGSGPAGSKVALKCAKAGWKVATVDYLYGGTCALRGCTPKKAMESVSTLAYQTRAMEGFGMPRPQSLADWEGIITHKKRFTELMPADTKEKFRRRGIEVLEGRAVFTGKKTLSINDEQRITADKIVIATGAKPRPLDFEGKEHLISSGELLNMTELPHHVLFAGGGYIAFEAAHIIAATGRKVTIVSDAEKPLSQFDPQLVSKLVQSTLDKGINIYLGYSVDKIVKKESGFEVNMARAQGGNSCSTQADLVVHSAGRVPNVESLNLEKAEVDYDEKGITVDDFMQSTSNEYVFAAGDVVDKYPLTPVASYEASIVVDKLLDPEQARAVQYNAIPSATFTSPKLASVGYLQSELEEENIDYKVKEGSMSDWLEEKRLNYKHSAYRVFVSKKGKILGAHIISSQAHEMINLFAMAIQSDMTAKQFKKFHFAYPTAGADAQKMV